MREKRAAEAAARARNLLELGDGRVLEERRRDKGGAAVAGPAVALDPQLGDAGGESLELAW